MKLACLRKERWTTIKKCFSINLAIGFFRHIPQYDYVLVGTLIPNLLSCSLIFLLIFCPLQVWFGWRCTLTQNQVRNPNLLQWNSISFFVLKSNSKKPLLTSLFCFYFSVDVEARLKNSTLVTGLSGSLCIDSLSWVSYSYIQLQVVLTRFKGLWSLKKYANEL